MLISISLGGTADAGYTDGQHYFLGQYGHYHEVPEKAYWFNYYYLHASMIALFLAASACATVTILNKRTRAQSES